MPIQKDFKRLVRARMKKTGESYTAARAQLVRRTASPVAAPADAKPSPDDHARLAGMSDAAIQAKTGCNWRKWVNALDHHGAAAMPHRDIAALVQEKFGVEDWWAQAVAVGYERIRGLREIGQRRGGGHEATKSRTLPVPVARLYRAFADARTRRRWLPGIKLVVRTATAPRSMRVTWPDGTWVLLHFTPKGATRSQVAVQHTRLADRAARERIKAFWAERLDALAEALVR